MRQFVSFAILMILFHGATLILTQTAAADEEASPAATKDGVPSDILPQDSSSDELPKESDISPSPAPSPQAADDQMTVKMHPKIMPTPKKVAAAKKASDKKAKNKKKTKVAAVAKPSPEPAPARPDGDTVLMWLKNGNVRFVKKKFRADGRNPADRERGLKGEQPNAAILTDSDSRVVPEIIFDQGLGEIYSVRTFGEAIDDSTLSALEYAVAQLNVPLLVVMGSSDSGALHVLNASKINENGDEVGEAPQSESLQEVIDQIRPRLKSVSHDSPSPHFEVEATLNADSIARELVKKSPLIAKAVKEGHLKIQTALYRLNTGKVSFY